MHMDRTRRIAKGAGKTGKPGDEKTKMGRGKEQQKRKSAAETLWLFGVHAVRDALMNPAREKLRLVVTKNAHDKLAEAIHASGITPEIVEPRKFSVPIDPQSVHQGAALEVKPLHWGSLAERAITGGDRPLRLILLDRVTDPHNVGAILRSAEVWRAGGDRHAASFGPRNRGACQDRLGGA